MQIRQANPAAIAFALLLITSCARVHPVQLAPPVAVPAGLVWDYGVERMEGSPDQARRRAYLGAVDDLLSRGPVMVSRAVLDSTLADDDSSTRTIETTFRLRAASTLEPRFIREGFEDGFAWVVVGAGEEDIARGWQEFLEWREVRIAEAEVLFQEADGLNRLPQLKASLEILEEAGAEMAPGLLYHRVRLALDVEREEVARLDRFRVEVDGLIREGNLLGAERRLSEALVSGLSLAEYESYTFQIVDQRSRAEAEVVAGDTF
jgi:hypothetical protein